MTISSRFKFTGTCLCSVSDVLADHGLSGLSHATRLRVEQPDEVSEIEEKQHDHNQAAADEVEMGHGCWRGGGRRRWRNEGSVAVGTPLTGVRHSRETGGTANVPRYRARGGHRILYRERPAAGPTETGIRRLCPAEWTRLRAVGNRGRCKHVLERALDEPAALSYVRSARLVNSNLHGARYRAAGARPGRSPAGWARLSPPARSRAGGAHLPTLSGLRSMESQNRGSSALASEPPRPTAPIRTHGDVARRYSARGSTRMGAVWFFGSVVPRRSESPRNKSCAVACVRSVASHQLLN